MKRTPLLAALLAAPLLAQAQPNTGRVLVQFKDPGDTSEPQKELPKEKLTIVTRDGKRLDFSVEMALTPEQQTVGLMFRKEVPADGGMLFDWGAPRDTTMWMRNTIAPLDMVFINQDGSIRRIAEDTVPRSLATIESGGPVRATLELGAGTVRRLGIHVGDKVEQRIFAAR